jgi:large subunit ribosomal protein L6
MSKIGANPIKISENVKIDISDEKVFIKGPKGELHISYINKFISINHIENKIVLSRSNETKQAKSQHGLYNSLIRNMVKGVTDGYQKVLDLVGVGYRAQKKGEGLILALGYSHPIEIAPINGIEFELLGDTKIIIKGIEKQLVGQVAANIRKLRPPEPYKGKGIKYSDEVIIRKAGKSSKK